MKKTDLYLYLNILNIIFAFYVVAMAFILFITLAMAPNAIMPACMFLLCIIIKFLLLPILFRIYEKKFPISILNKVQNELKTNKKIRKSVLLLAFYYDAVIILFFAFPLLKEAHFGSLLFFPILWEIYTLGGICMFYISLFLIWKIQDKKISRTK